MDGNGRWAKERGLPRTEGHKVGRGRVLDVLKGAIEMGVKNLSLYAFSTENWKRSPDEVRFLMNFNRDVIRRRRDEMDGLGIRVRWAGRMPRLWKSVVKELQIAQEQTKDNDVLTLTSASTTAAAPRSPTPRGAGPGGWRGEARPGQGRREAASGYLYYPDMPDVDMFLRPSGEQRTSNYLLWQARTPRWCSRTCCGPTSTGGTCGEAIDIYARRDRRLRHGELGWLGGQVSAAGSPAGAALGAGAEDLQRVLDLGEAVLGGDPGRPTSRRPGPRPRRCAAARQTRWWWWPALQRR